METGEHSDYCWTELPAGDIETRLQQLARQGDGTAVTGFLDTHQWSPLLEMPGITVSGGHPAAQFRRAALGAAEIGTVLFRIASQQLPPGIHTARQLRSWLYRTDLPDGCIGDIICTRDHTVLVTEPGIEPLEVGLPAGLLHAWQEPPVEVQRATAAGTRIDAMAAILFRVSRGEARTAVEHGFIFRGFAPVTKRTAQVQAGDQLVFRTKGRTEIIALDTNPRSGRQWVEYRSYPA